MSSNNTPTEMFTRCTVRNKIYSNKKKLKETKFLISESLTSQRYYHLLKESQEKYGVKNIWTSDGRILFKQKNRILIYKR